MGKVLSALLRLQTIERELSEVNSRLRVRQNAVGTQERRIEEFRSDWGALNDQRLERRKSADSLELDLAQRDEKVSELRGVLNTARTNKEYAAVLTEINTIKADNSKLEEQVLAEIEAADQLKLQADEVQTKVEQEEKRLQEIAASAAEEVAKLEAMKANLSAKRDEAATHVPPEELARFERIASSLGGDAMVPIEVGGDKPPYDYICGGCFMSLNAEHANALRSRDEIRTCDSCGRILYLDIKEQAQHQS